MRLLGRALLLLLALAGTAWLAQLDWRLPQALRARAAAASPGLPGALTSLAYVLERGRWTELALADPTGTLRLISNARLAPGTPIPPETRWTYALRLQIMDDQGRLLLERTEHQRTRLTQYRRPGGGGAFLASQFRDVPGLATDSRLSLLSLAGLGRSARLRLRLAAADPEVEDVSLRLYQRGRVPEREREILWQRLSEADRAQAARGSVYGPLLLSPYERRALVAWRWQPLAPKGIPGRDYQERTVLAVPPGAKVRLEEPPPPFGVLVTAALNGIVALPPESGALDLELSPIAAPAAPVEARWYGIGPEQRARYTLHPGAGAVHLRQDLEGGLLELASTSPWVARAYWRDAQGRREITPGPRYLRVYRCGPGGGLRYAIDHDGERATPLRIELRPLLRVAPDVPPVAEYALLAPDGLTLSQGRLPVTTEPSRYDQLPRAVFPDRVAGEPTRIHLAAPPRARELLLSARAPLLVAVYTRPPDLAWRQRVPEGYSAFEDDAERVPAWFPLRPRNAQALLESRRALGLRVQPRPPQDDPEVLAGRYEWLAYQPEGDWTGRYLLLPRAPGSPLRAEARASTYRTVGEGAQDLDLRGAAGGTRLRPRLIFLRRASGHARVEVRLDGETVYRGPISGRRGELSLPEVHAGAHRLRVRGPAGITWLVNYAGAGPGARQRLLAYRLGRQGLRFVYAKTSARDELLILRLHARYGQLARARLRAEVDTGGARGYSPSPTWTLPRRVYDVAPNPEHAVPVLGTRDGQVGAGRRLFLRLGQDLPPGRYPIQLIPETDGELYLSLYRLQPGDYTHGRWSRLDGG